MINSFLTGTGKSLGMIASLLYGLGSCERDSKPKEMFIPLTPILKGDAVCCRLYKLNN